MSPPCSMSSPSIMRPRLWSLPCTVSQPSLFFMSISAYCKSLDMCWGCLYAYMLSKIISWPHLSHRQQKLPVIFCPHTVTCSMFLPIVSCFQPTGSCLKVQAMKAVLFLLQVISPCFICILLNHSWQAVACLCCEVVTQQTWKTYSHALSHCDLHGGRTGLPALPEGCGLNFHSCAHVLH